MKALDYGFYYDDPDLPIIVSPVKTIGQEWRFVIVGREVVAGSSYHAETRTERAVGVGNAWDYAQEIAKELIAPQIAYVMDVCETDDGLRLLELNPFSGADLYACDRDAIVKSVSKLYA